MAQEITISNKVEIKKGNLSDKWEPGTRRVDLASAVQSAGVLTVGTTERTLPVGDVTANGLLMLESLDATAIVDFGPDNAGTILPLGQLKYNEPAFFRLKNGVTMKLKSDTASTSVAYKLLSN